MWIRHATCSTLRFWSLLTLLSALTTMVGYSQVITGTILGTVRDESGSVIPGATLTATNLNTGFHRQVVSGEDGHYAIAPLPVGDYRVQVELPGFKTQVQAPVNVRIDTKVRVDFLLEIGEITDQVLVESQQPLTSRDSSEMGQIIENRRVSDLPLNGRQFVQLTLLTPGVVNEVRGTLSDPLALSGFSFNANGTRYDSNMFLLDGVNARDNVYARLTVSPSIDAIEEFKVHTSNYSAEFGGQGGAQVNITTKSGTNQFHGSVFEFIRNDVLDARNFFDRERPPFRLNQFGFSLGGPIKHDRTFFFANYEGQRIVKGISITAAVPTTGLRGGDFRGVAPIVDPLTGRPFQHEGQTNVIPPSRITPFAQGLLGKIPAPTSPGLGRNFAGFGTRDLDMDQFTARIDHAISADSSLFGRFTYSDVKDLEPIPGVLLGAAAANPLRPPGFGQTTDQKSSNLAIQHTYIFSPAVVNQVRFGHNYLDAGQFSENAAESFGQEFGFLGINPPPLGSGFPVFSIVGFSIFGDANTQLFTRNNDFAIHDDVSYISGNHGLKFGATYTRSLVLTQFVFNTAGQFNFLGVFTGHPFADFLLGYPSVANALTGDPLLHGEGHRFGAYFQDDWRVSDRLTLNLGIRYDVITPYRERDNKLANFAPEIGGFVVAGSPGNVHPSADFDRFPGVPFATASELGYPDALTEVDSNNFAPRLGFAYSVTDSLVLRGGAGIFYSTGILGGRFGIMGFNPPFTGLTLFLNFDPSNPIRAQEALVSPAANLVIGQGPQRDFPNSYTSQWNLSLQKQLLSSLMVEVAYTGSKGTHLDGTLLPNQPTASPEPLEGRLRWPAIGPDQILAAPAFDSWYHGLILRTERRFAQGLAFSSSYTFSKSLDTNTGSLSNASGAGAPQFSGNLAAEKGRSQFDVRHRFVFNGIYELPFGSGKRLLSGTDNWAAKLFWGWQTNLILIAQTGQPITPLVPTDRSNTGVTNDRPDLVGDPNNGPKTPDRWFNVDAFALQPFGEFGNAGRSIIDGPGFQSVDLAFLKRTAINDNVTFEFRGEIFNLLNRVNFELPSRVFGTPGFGQIFQARDPREIQFGLKLIF